MMVDPYAFKVLQKDHHAQLVADLSGYAQDAGIQPVWICKALPDTISDQERDYLRGFRRHAENSVSGLILHGKNTDGKVETHMSAMTGALVRNFIRARVMTLGTLIDHLAKGDVPDIAALMIPNFFLSASEGGTVAPWQVNALFDYLTYRHVSGMQTVLYASDMALLGKEYGMAFKGLIEAHYLKSKI